MPNERRETDPFADLQSSLKGLFLAKAWRNQTYTDNEVQNLKEALEKYHTGVENAHVGLLRALKEVMPQLSAKKIPIEPVKAAMDELAHQDDWGKIQWDEMLDPRLQKPQRAHDLLGWLERKTGVASINTDKKALCQGMIDLCRRKGFSERLITYLEKEPDFLFDLIMQDETNFIDISKSQLILFLTDEQLARAIIKHSSALLHEEEGQEERDPYEQAALLVKKLDRILSKGRSVSTLLRNTKAKSILEQSEIFQAYQSDAYENQSDDAHFNTSPSLS